MKIIIAFLLSFTTQYALASGCGHEYELRITKTESYKTFNSDEYEVIRLGDNFARIRLPDKSEITLVLTTTETGVKTPSPDEGQLKLDDVLFDEGGSCGPVYICATGRYTVKLNTWDYKHTVKTFSWPVINENALYESPYDREWAANSLLPVFGTLKAEHGNNNTDKAQCVYGDW